MVHHYYCAAIELCGWGIASPCCLQICLVPASARWVTVRGCYG